MEKKYLEFTQTKETTYEIISYHNFYSLNDYLFHFFLSQQKNKIFKKNDNNIIIDAKLYLKYMNKYSKYETPEKVEIYTFNNIYHLVHFNITQLCKKNNEIFNQKLIQLQDYNFDNNFHLIKNYNSFYSILDNIKNEITISDKINSIFHIFNIITSKYPKIISDELITLISYIIVKCQVKDLLTEVEFINFFYDEGTHCKIGIKEFCFITFYGSIENIMNITEA